MTRATCSRRAASVTVWTPEVFEPDRRNPTLAEPGWGISLTYPPALPTCGKLKPGFVKFSKSASLRDKQVSQSAVLLLSPPPAVDETKAGWSASVLSQVPRSGPGAPSLCFRPACRARGRGAKAIPWLPGHSGSAPWRRPNGVCGQPASRSARDDRESWSDAPLALE